ncbi:MAG TPA: hypothetical protein VF516_05425, partial [Kofleriaceae bacterium]
MAALALVLIADPLEPEQRRRLPLAARRVDALGDGARPRLVHVAKQVRGEAAWRKDLSVEKPARFRAQPARRMMSEQEGGVAARGPSIEVAGNGGLRLTGMDREPLLEVGAGELE